MKVTWFGTASIALDDGKTKLLLDPFLRMNRRLPKLKASLFTGFDAVLLSHGHFDHISDLPAILKLDETVPVYCTAAPKASLVKRGVSPGRFRDIAPGSSFSVGDFTVNVLAGQHIDFDINYILSVLPGCVARFPQTFKLLYYIKALPENGEIVAFKITNGGFTALVLGSYGFAPGETYPTGPDLFVLPFSGNSGLAERALPELADIRPKRILFDHFDDSFPPLTKRMDVEGFKARINLAYPDIKVQIPKEGVGYLM